MEESDCNFEEKAHRKIVDAKLRARPGLFTKISIVKIIVLLLRT